MGVGPIPYNVLRDYARDEGLDDETRPIFIRTIQAMDTVWLENQREEIEAKRKDPPKKR